MSDETLVFALVAPVFAAAFALGYLLGSIPFGMILTRIAGLGDIRAIGSGNIGATNVLRTGRKGLAAATLILDALKGSAAVWLAEFVMPDVRYFGLTLPILAAAGAFLGHLYPVWLKFRGGKGVATYLGIVLALWWPSALLFAVLWLGVARLFHRSSLAAILAAPASALAALIASPTGAFAAMLPPGLAAPRPFTGLLLIGLSVVLLLRHRQNIARLLAGTEPRIGEHRATGAS